MKSPNVPLAGNAPRKPQTSDSPLSPKAVYGGESAERLISARQRMITKKHQTGKRNRNGALRILAALRNRPVGARSALKLDSFLLDSRGEMGTAVPNPLLGALPQTPPGTSPWTLSRFARHEASWRNRPVGS